MNSIIQYLLIQNQYLLQIISFLFKFICSYIPLRQWIFDDSNSPEYQKFKVDEPPLIKQEKLRPQEGWNYKDFIAYIKRKYDIDINPVYSHHFSSTLTLNCLYKFFKSFKPCIFNNIMSGCSRMNTVIAPIFNRCILQHFIEFILQWYKYRFIFYSNFFGNFGKFFYTADICIRILHGYAAAAINQYPPILAA